MAYITISSAMTALEYSAQTVLTSRRLRQNCGIAYEFWLEVILTQSKAVRPASFEYAVNMIGGDTTNKLCNEGFALEDVGGKKYDA